IVLALYSDASSVPKGTGIGVGLVGFDLAGATPVKIYAEMSNIGKGQIVYNGEIEGIARALEYGAQVAKPGQQIIAFSDNQAGLLRMKTQSTDPGQSCQLRCIKAGKEIQIKGASVTIKWVPGHSKVAGNHTCLY
ncbi:hypothetical protein K402DRAFT_434830, partial [Aulographum hederae CBS 113979]